MATPGKVCVMARRALSARSARRGARATGGPDAREAPDLYASRREPKHGPKHIIIYIYTHQNTVHSTHSLWKSRLPFNNHIRMPLA